MEKISKSYKTLDPPPRLSPPVPPPESSIFAKRKIHVGEGVGRGRFIWGWGSSYRWVSACNSLLTGSVLSNPHGDVYFTRNSAICTKLQYAAVFEVGRAVPMANSARKRDHPHSRPECPRAVRVVTVVTKRSKKMNIIFLSFVFVLTTMTTLTTQPVYRRLQGWSRDHSHLTTLIKLELDPETSAK